jgi:ferric-dicitrate binding protein FerR (iron transport regulator)
MSDFFNWLTDKSKNGKPEYRDYVSLWEASRVDGPQPPASQDMWYALRARMAAEPGTVSDGWFQGLLQRPVFAMAAMIMLLAGVWFINQPTTFSVNRGVNLKQVTLDDQSTVTLNAETRLVLARGFNKQNRDVTLEGEAYFHVEKGHAPFVIRVGDATVRVVGTRFNVFARQDVVRIDVTEGVVKCSSNNQTVTLKAGESSEIRQGHAPQEPKSNRLKGSRPAWIKGGFDCREKPPLSQVCEELERRYDVDIRISPSTAREEIGGVFNADTTEEALGYISSIMDITYRFEDGVYIIE